MKKNNCDQFFSELALRWKNPARIHLIGGAAAQAYGVNRFTVDVDFEAILPDNNREWNLFEEAVRETEKITGIKAQFGENIDRWSRITLLDYRKHLKHYKDFQKLKVYLLKPEYWSIGKISRFWDSDIGDMVAVFKNENTDPLSLAKIWMLALRRSERHSDLFNIKKNAAYFFVTYGKEIWGKKFSEEEIKKIGF